MIEPRVIQPGAGLPAESDAPASTIPSASDVEQPEPPRLVEVDLLVEDVAIDGMCGVY